jgi:hypothetical protein
MRAVAITLVVLLFTTAAQAQMPQQWKSTATPDAERDLLQCVMQNPNTWGSSCGKDAAIFVQTCQKSEGLSESACRRVMQLDITAIAR